MQENYFKLPGLTASDIKNIYRSPAHYKEARENPPETTAAMEFGTAAHMAILEPERFKHEYMTVDDERICEEIGGARPRSTNKYKDWYASIVEDNPGKIIMDKDAFENVQKLADAVRSHSVAGKLLDEPGDVEQSIEWIYSPTGTPMKSRLDAYLHSGKIIDIKTCEDARPAAFSRDIWKYLYHIQAAVYCRAVEETTGELCKFIFIAVEKSSPHGVMVYELDETTLQLGLSDMDRCIRIFEECKASGFYPAYAEELRPIQLPAWAQVTEVV